MFTSPLGVDMWVFGLFCGALGTPSRHSDSLYQQVTVWIIGGGSIYAEALSREDLPVFGCVEIIERTLLDSLEDIEIAGEYQIRLCNLHL